MVSVRNRVNLGWVSFSHLRSVIATGNIPGNTVHQQFAVLYRAV